MTDTADPREEIVVYLPAMRAFARSLTGDLSSADDLVQDTVVKAWSKFHTFIPGSNLQAWLFAILRNTFYSSKRRSGREVGDPEGTATATLAGKPDHDGRLALRDFAAAFAQLPVEQREALILVGASGLSYEEAAQTTGVAVGTLKSRANRARKRLAEIMGLKEGEDLVITDQSTQAVISANRSSPV